MQPDARCSQPDSGERDRGAAAFEQEKGRRCRRNGDDRAPRQEPAVQRRRERSGENARKKRARRRQAAADSAERYVHHWIDGALF